MNLLFVSCDVSMTFEAVGLALLSLDRISETGILIA